MESLPSLENQINLVDKQFLLVQNTPDTSNLKGAPKTTILKIHFKLILLYKILPASHVLVFLSLNDLSKSN